jgi:hypothetical protein
MGIAILLCATANITKVCLNKHGVLMQPKVSQSRRLCNNTSTGSLKVNKAWDEKFGG